MIFTVKNFVIFQQIHKMSLTTENTEPVLSLDTDTQELDIVLKAFDGQSITLPYSYCKLSKVLTEIISQLSTEDNVVDLPLIHSINVLKYIGKFLCIHKGTEPTLIEKPLRTADLTQLTIKDNIEFIDEILIEGQIPFLYEVLSAANYIQCNSLINLLCAKIASMIKGKPIDQIKSILNP